MFRLKLYWNDIGDAENALTLTTEAFRDQDTAHATLEQLQASWGKSLTGSATEQHVPGIGWVLADEIETVQIIARRREESIFVE